MADIFISYSRQEPYWTQSLAADLEAWGYSTWWDTRLLPSDGFFPKRIRDELEVAKVVIVIWSEHSVNSQWVYSEAQIGQQLSKLITLHTPDLDLRKVPLPFNAWNSALVTDRATLYAALLRIGMVPTRGLPAPTATPRSSVPLEPEPRLPSGPRFYFSSKIYNNIGVLDKIERILGVSSVVFVILLGISYFIYLILGRHPIPDLLGVSVDYFMTIYFAASVIVGAIVARLRWWD